MKKRFWRKQHITRTRSKGTKSMSINYIKKVCLYFLIVLLGLHSLWSTPADSELSILFDDFFQEFLVLNPSMGNYLGLTADMGYDFDQTNLVDFSDSRMDLQIDLLSKYYDKAKSFSVKELTESEQLDLSVFQHYLKNELDSDVFRYHNYYITHMYGIHYHLLNLMTENHPINSVTDAENYLIRLEKFSSCFDQYLLGLRKQTKLGIIPPAVIIEKSLEIFQEFILSQPEKNIYYTVFNDQVNNLSEIDIIKKIELKKSCLELMNSSVYTSYQSYIAVLLEILPEADDIAGLWKLPDGDKYYEYCLRFHTTTDLTPQQIHDIGLTEVERIQKIINEKLLTLGISIGEDFKLNMYEYWNLFQGDLLTDNSFPKSESGRDSVIEHYLEILAETEERLPTLFSVLPKTKVTVKRVPSYKENISGQYYEPAPLDGSKPAVFYTNLSWIPDKPGMRTLLYHETIPGHHLQFALSQELTSEQMFKKLTFFTAFLEGWALYAEKLGYEYDWHDTEYSRIGYLTSELFRAVRLVVDTGIHYKKWTRVEAYTYMEDNLGWGSYGQIDRYIVWPGQACAYKIGELKILELREKFKDKMKEDFDIKEFHKLILDSGALPLLLLERKVDNYINKNL